MGTVKMLMEDYCELATRPIENSADRCRAFDKLFAQLCSATGIWPAEMRSFFKVKDAIERMQPTTGERRLRWATKLWNAIDHTDNPEPLWLLMQDSLPDVFYADGSNCMKFTY